MREVPREALRARGRGDLPRERLPRSLRATALAIAVNGLLAAVKIATGIAGHSNALVADGIESFADLASSLIVWRGAVVADRPPDRGHPYGHGRAETLAAAAVAVLLIAAAGVILVQSGREILTPHRTPAPFTLFVLLAVVLIKEGLYRFVSRVGTEIASGALAADAWHHRSDAITSAAAALGISAALVGGPGYEAADDWAAILAAAIIAWNGVRLLRPPLRELMDAAPESNVVEGAIEVALAVPGVRAVEKCLARKMGYAYLLDMHVEVDPALTVAAAHDLAHAVKDAIRAARPRIQEVTIHIEPHAAAPVGPPAPGE